MYSKKPVISGHSKEDQKLVFKADYRLMQVKVLQNTSESMCTEYSEIFAKICIFICEVS